MWRYQWRPRHPPHMDTRFSHADVVHPDELDEEFDTFPTSQGNNIIRMRYNRLRSIAGRIQSVVGDLATQGERFQSTIEAPTTNHLLPRSRDRLGVHCWVFNIKARR